MKFALSAAKNSSWYFWHCFNNYTRMCLFDRKSNMTWGRFTPNIILFPFSVPDTFSTLLRFAVKTFCVCHKKKINLVRIDCYVRPRSGRGREIINPKPKNKNLGRRPDHETRAKHGQVSASDRSLFRRTWKYCLTSFRLLTRLLVVFLPLEGFKHGILMKDNE